MAGLWSAGRVGIDVEPVTTGFYAKLDAELARAAGKEIEVTANLDLDDGSARRRLREWDGKTAELRIKADDSQVRRLVSQWNGKNLNAKLDLDTKKFKRELSDVEGELKKVRNQTSWQKYWWDKSVDSAEKYTKLLERQKQLTKQQSNLLKNEINNRMSAVRSMQDAILKTSPFGASNVFDQQDANKIVARYRQMLKQVEKNPARVKLMLDDANYRTVIARLEKVTREKAKAAEENSRVRLYLDGADKLEARLKALEHTRLTIPAEIKVEQENMIRRLRETAERVRLNPDAKYEVNLDVDMKRAEERIKKFKDDNDTLNMDVDLETAAARAHLMYFTRPRTVDIFARFRGTDMGKILSGMTTGATGIRGVENEFQKLVNMFDKFDQVVPKWSMIGAVLTSIGAGALNVGRTIGGMGASIVSMSKAALAAPAALTGLGAAFASFKMIYGDKGATWSEQIDIASTKLGTLSDTVVSAFYGKARPAVRSLADEISGNLITGMKGLAENEGRIVEGMADMVKQANKADQITHIFSSVNQSLNNLVPGMKSAVTAFLTLGDATDTYLPRMASYMSRMLERGSQWVEMAEKTGAVSTAMEKAIEQGGYLKDSVKALAGILSGTFGTLAQYENGIEGFSNALQRADKAVNGARFQETLTAWADGAKKASTMFHDSFTEIGNMAYSLKDTTSQVFVDAGSMVSNAISGISGMLTKSKTGIADFSSGVSEGFSKLFSAVNSAGPMFSSLLSMVGQLSNTFGSTLANTLKAASPTIQAMVKGAETVAKAFNALPGPIQAVIGMYATFGKAGISAWNSLKTGMLQNITSTLQYKQTMSQLGVSSKQTAVSMRELVQAMARLKSGQIAGVLTGETSSIRQMGVAADETRAKLTRMNESAASSKFLTANSSGSQTGLLTLVGGSLTKVGEEAEKAGEKVAKASGKLSGLKTVASGVFDFLGGPVGLAIGGVTTALSLASSAVDTYNSSVEHTNDVNESVAQSFKKVQGSATDVASSVADARKKVSKNWSDTSYGWDTSSSNAVEKMIKGYQQWASPFKDSTKAAKELGISINDLNTAATSSNKTYDAMHERLTKIKEDQDWVMGSNGQMIDMNATQEQAAERLLSVLENSNKEWKKGQKVIKDYVNFAGEGSDATAMLTDNTNAYSDALSLMNSSLAANNYDFDKNKSLIADVGTSAKLSAASMMAYAESKKKNGQATKESAKYEQLAKNSIYEARQEVIQAAIACGQSQEAAEKYADSLGLIPDQVSTKLSVDKEQAVSEVNQLLDRLSLTTGQKDCILNLVRTGAITDFEQVQEIIKGLTNGADSHSYTVLVQAYTNGTIDVEQLNNLIKKMADGKHQIIVTADGKIAAVTADELKQKYIKLEDGTYKLKVDADDQASKKLDDLEKKKVPAAKGVSFKIDADDNDANVKLAKYEGYDNVTLATAHAYVDGDDSGAQNAFNNTRSYDGVTLARPWGRVQGEHTLADLAFAAIQAFDNVTIARPWGRVMGENNDAQRAFRDTRAYDGMTISRPWGRVMGDDSNVQSVFTSIRNTNGTTLATRYVDIVTRSSGSESVRAATGGRIHGPGTDTSDSIPALLSNNEAVIRAASLKKLDAKYGKSFFNYLNAYGDLPLKYRNQVAQAKTASVQSNGVKYRSQIQRFANGGRVQTLRNGWNVVVNPEVKVDGSKGTVVNQTFNTKVVRSNDDLYAAAPILHRNALSEARRFQR